MDASFSESLNLDGPRPALRSASVVRDQVDSLVRLAVFGDHQQQQLARFAIHAAAPELGLIPSSIQDLYAARGRGEVSGFTVPAVNIRGMAYDTSRALFRAMKSREAAATVFEIARSEIGYTHQEPAELAAVILAAGIAEGYPGRVFIQGDHFQANAGKFAADPAAETAALEELVTKAVAAQFYCIDIDASTLVDLSYDDVSEQQAENSKLTARLSKLVRSLEPKGVTVSVGGEIGEVGKSNSTVEELVAYVDGFREIVGGDAIGLSKVSVQTGTSHGGIPLPDGTIAKVAIDFGTLRELSIVSRERYGMAGAVQHGASTLPDEAFHEFPKVETAEIHLATGFQNITMDHDAFPAGLLQSMRDYTNSKLSNERKDGETDVQFFYKTRKKTWGPFKQQVWDLPDDVRTELGSALQGKFEFLIDQLKAGRTGDLVDKYITHAAAEVVPPAVPANA
jgi:fructose-bisphosphate aldolase, class II